MKTYREKIDLIKRQIEAETPAIDVDILHRAAILPPQAKSPSMFSWRKLTYGMSGLLVVLITLSLFILPKMINDQLETANEPELTSDAMNEIDALPLVTLASFYRDNRKLFQNDGDQPEDENIKFVNYYLSTLDVYIQIPTKTPIAGRFGLDYGILYEINLVSGAPLTFEVFFNEAYSNNENGTIEAKVVVADEAYNITGTKEVTDDAIWTNLTIEYDSSNYMTVRTMKSSIQSFYTYSIFKDQVLVTTSSFNGAPTDEKVTLYQNKLNESLSVYEVQIDDNQFVIDFTNVMEERYDGADPIYSLDSELTEWVNSGYTLATGQITAAFDESFIYYAVNTTGDPIHEETVPLE
jgi:hypothetical protein